MSDTSYPTMTKVLHKLFGRYDNGDIVFRYKEDTDVRKILGEWSDPELLDIFLGFYDSSPTTVTEVKE